MKVGKAVFAIAVACFCAWAAEDAVAAPAAAQDSRPTIQDPKIDVITIPRMLSYQGKLTDTGGNPVRDSTYSVVFRLYTVPSGGTAFWNETQSVQTRSGLFTALLGSVTPIGYVPDGGALYLGMQVGAAELTPRLRLVSAAYAYKADSSAYAAAATPVGPAGGDLAGTYPNPTVAQKGATSGQVLKWSGSAWLPRDDSVGGGGGTVTSVSQNTGIVCTPNPITTTGSVGFDQAWGDGRYVNEGQANSVSNSMLQNNAVTSAKIQDSTIVRGDVVRSFKAPYSDTADFARTGAGAGSVTEVRQSSGIICTPNPIITTGFVSFDQNYGDTRYVNVPGDSMTGSLAVQGQVRSHDKARLGGLCANPGNNAFVAGYEDTARGDYSSVTGGRRNAGRDFGTHVGGGFNNICGGAYAVISGGYYNSVNGDNAVVAGGSNNSVTNSYGAVLGGSQNAASGYHSSVGGGNQNIASNSYAAIAGGVDNDARGQQTFIGGGYENHADTLCAVVCGGNLNTASAAYAFVGGGTGNDAAASCATVGGGDNNWAGGDRSTIAGGWFNQATGAYAFIGGGRENLATAPYSFVGGGSTNRAVGTHATVSGGYVDSARGPYSTVSGGNGNRTDTTYCTVAGGCNNAATGYGAVVSGGRLNTASGYYAMIPGGYADSCAGDYALAAGTGVRVRAEADYTFAFGENILTTTPRAVVFYHSGGTTRLGVGVQNPAYNIQVAGGAYCDGTSWVNASSWRLKRDIAGLTSAELTRVLEELGRTEVVRYRYASDESGEEHIGLVAEDAPELLATPARDGINTGDAIGWLVAVAKAQQAEIEALKAALAERK